MSRSPDDNKILNLLYRGTTTIQQFCWDSMTSVPILYLISPAEIAEIRKLILSPRYAGNNKFKMKRIDEIMGLRGFTRFAGGTNRLVYIHPDVPNAVYKVAIDSVGIGDNPAEYKNQNLLKPYCCKVFECSPCGTIASFERVERITTIEEFYTIADDYFYILYRTIIGKYVMEDIGIDFFMNVGIRKGCHPVLLDFPYLFELDGRKLECMSKLDDGTICHGDIDYDHGFNKLICKKCGRVYHARDLAKDSASSGILLREGGVNMEVIVMRGNKVIKRVNGNPEKKFIAKEDPDMNTPSDNTSSSEHDDSMEVVVMRGGKVVKRVGGTNDFDISKEEKEKENAAKAEEVAKPIDQNGICRSTKPDNIITGKPIVKNVRREDTPFIVTDVDSEMEVAVTRHGVPTESSIPVDDVVAEPVLESNELNKFLGEEVVNKFANAGIKNIGQYYNILLSKNWYETLVEMGFSEDETIEIGVNFDKYTDFIRGRNNTNENTPDEDNESSPIEKDPIIDEDEIKVYDEENSNDNAEQNYQMAREKFNRGIEFALAIPENKNDIRSDVYYLIPKDDTIDEDQIYDIKQNFSLNDLYWDKFYIYAFNDEDGELYNAEYSGDMDMIYITDKVEIHKPLKSSVDIPHSENEINIIKALSRKANVEDITKNF